MGLGGRYAGTFVGSGGGYAGTFVGSWRGMPELLGALGGVCQNFCGLWGMPEILRA